MKRGISGFSLLELAVIVLILGMMTVLLLPVFNARLQKQESVSVHSLLERADWALTGFVMAHHRLPCPDINHDGKENCPAAETGALPYQTLGIADAAAGQVRYGVLIRSAQADPEEVDQTASPALPRGVDLTASVDRFYPFLALMRSPGTVFAGENAVLPELATGGNGNPVNDPTPVTPHHVSFAQEDTLDFCWALRVAEDSLPANAGAHVHMRTGGAARQIAYGIALPGIPGNVVDNPPPSDPREFTAPQGLAEARVRAVTSGALWDRLRCGEAMAAIGHAQPDAATAAVMLYRGLFDFEQVLEQSHIVSQRQFELAISSVLSAASKVTGAIATGLKAAAMYLGSPDDIFKAPVETTKAVTAGIVSAALTTVAVPNLIVSYNKREMAGQRYHHVQGFRASARLFAQELLNHVRRADRWGLYRPED
jgi:type II secretory pathway pseudopilin PulG